MCGFCGDDTCKGDPCLLQLEARTVERAQARSAENILLENLTGSSTPLVPLSDDDEEDDVRPWHEGPRGMLGGRFGYPLLWDRIYGNLFQGGCVDRLQLPSEFKHVVSLYPWERYALCEGTDRVEYKLYDSNDQDLSQVIDIAKQVNELCDDGPTLVHCQMGLNRSGVVCATALVLQGMPPEEAIKLLRDQRDPYVLCNPSFERFVLRLDV